MCAVTHDALGNSVPCAVLRSRYVITVLLYCNLYSRCIKVLEQDMNDIVAM